MSRTIQVSSPAMPSVMGSPALEFKSMDGSESLGELFRYTIQLQTPDSSSLTAYVTANVDVKQLVGKEFNVVIELDGSGFGIDAGLGAGTREINGLVTSARFVRSEDRRGVYEVVIEPWLVLAKRTSDYKIFQNKTPLAIIREVLADYSFATEVRISHAYSERKFQVQYGETDFTFISRLMQEWGIYYFHEHKGGIHKLILVDDAGAHKPFDSAAYQTISYYPPGHKIEEEYCSDFNTSENLQSGVYVTGDFDFEKPGADLKQKSKMPRNTGQNTQELIKWPGDYTDPGEGLILAKIRMEEAGAPGSRASGGGNLRGVVPGCTFTLANYPQDKANQTYLVVGATLSLSESGQASGQAAYHCHAEFQVRPAGNTFRSPQTVPKPHTTGPQTAIVTGPAGQEIWTDSYARVKVQFHWDRYGLRDENSSCWIRVSSPWAGTNFGGISIPRIGQEVIVDFENGDPDRPLITGRVYNARNMPPWELPANQTQSGILTRSSIGGGAANANALRFEDLKGEEQLWLHAEKNQLTEVEHDEDKWVGHDRRKTVDHDETNHIRNDRTETVDGHEKITVHKTRTETVDGNEDLTVHANRTRTVDGNEKETVKKNKTETIRLFYAQTIGMAAIQTIGLARMVNVGLAYNRNIGTVMVSNIGLTRVDSVGQSWTQNVGTDYHLTAKAKYRVETGKASITMTPEGDINLVGTKITLNGQELTKIVGGGSFSKWEAASITHGTMGAWIEHAASRSGPGPMREPVPGEDTGPAEEECIPCKNAAAAATAHSISFAMGTERLTHTDFVLEAPLPIQWSRRYHSALSAYDASELGARWITPYTTCLQVLDPAKPEQVRWHAGDGRSHDYELPVVGASYTDIIEGVVLRRESPTRLVIDYGPEWQEVFESVRTQWRLVRQQTPQGTHIELRYAPPVLPAPPADGLQVIPEREDAHALTLRAPRTTARLTDIVSYQGETVMAHAQMVWDETTNRITALHEIRDDKPMRQLAAYRYDEAGDLVEAQDENAVVLDAEEAGASAWHYAYVSHLLTRYTDRTGRGMNIQWQPGKSGRGPDSRAVREWADDGSFDTCLSWASDSGAVTVIDALGQKTVHHVDSRGYTRRIDHPDGRVERFMRDAAKNVVEHQQLNGTVDYFRYESGADGLTRLIEHRRADGSTIGYGYTAQGHLASVQDLTGGSWRRAYTPAGLLASQTDPLGRITAYEYNEANRLTGIVDAKGGRKKLAYTPAGQLASFTDCSGQTTQWEFDGQGRQQSITNAQGQKTVYAYERGQLHRITTPDGKFTELQSDAEGRLLQHTDPLGRQTTYKYTASGLIAERHQQMQAGQSPRTLAYRWDKLARMTQLINENGARYEFGYDVMNRLIEERDFDGQHTRYRHENHAVIVQAAHLLTRYEQDPMGRLVRREAKRLERVGDKLVPAEATAQVETFQYDLGGRTLSAGNDASQLQWGYDPVGNVVREHHAYNFVSEPFSRIWQHEYDELNQRVATIRPGGQRVQWLTYGSGHVHGLMLDGRELVGFERDKLHREVNRIQGNGLSQMSAYDGMGRLVGQQLKASPMGEREPGTSAGTTATTDTAGTRPTWSIKRQYGYNDGNQLTTIEDSRRGLLAYGYDPADRLIEARSRLGTELFDFDPASNLLATRNPEDDAKVPPAMLAGRQPHVPALLDNLLRRFNDSRREYDALGNLIERGEPGEQPTKFSWDVFNRLSGLRREGDIRVRYFYDPLGRRIGKHTEPIVAYSSGAGPHYERAEMARLSQERGLGTTTYGWDGNTLAMENGRDATLHYFYEPNSFTPMLQVRVGRDSAGQSRSELAWYQCDHLGTPMELTDERGEVVWSADYKAFGQTTLHRDRYAVTGTRINNIRFQGQYFDEESGLHYNRYRYYDPKSGRYISKDPIGLKGGVNKLIYVNGSPVKYSDPLGLIHYNNPAPKTVPVTGNTETQLNCMESCIQRKTNKADLNLLVTGGAEKNNHSKKSFHYKGEAFDLAGPKHNKICDDAAVKECATACGVASGQFETFPENPNRNHWHFQSSAGNGVPALPANDSP